MLIIATFFSSNVVKAQENSVVSITTEKDNVALQNPLTLSFSITNTENLGSYQMQLSYDESMLEFKDVTYFGMFEEVGRVSSPINTEDEPGKITIGEESFGDASGFTGDFIFAEVSFATLASGFSSITIEKIELTDPIVNTIAHALNENNVSYSIGIPQTTITTIPTPTTNKTPVSTQEASATAVITNKIPSPTPLSPTLFPAIGGISIESEKKIDETTPIDTIESTLEIDDFIAAAIDYKIDDIASPLPNSSVTEGNQEITIEEPNEENKVDASKQHNSTITPGKTLINSLVEMKVVWFFLALNISAILGLLLTKRVFAY